MFSAAVTVKWEVSLLTVHQVLLDVTFQLLALVVTVISLLPPLSRKVDGCVGYLQGDCFISIPISPSTGDLFLTAA